jgi:hypothetical protein
MSSAEPAVKRRTLRTPRQRSPEGDDRVTAALADLEAPGFWNLHRVDTGYGEVDHVVVGPTGAFAVTVTQWTGDVHAKRGRLLNGYHDEERTRRRAIWSAACLEQWLDEDGVDIPVAALLVPTKAQVEDDRIELPYLTVLPPDSLTAFLRDGPNVLAPNRIQRAARAIAAHAATASVAS